MHVSAALPHHPLGYEEGFLYTVDIREETIEETIMMIEQRLDQLGWRNQRLRA